MVSYVLVSQVQRHPILRNKTHLQEFEHLACEKKKEFQNVANLKWIKENHHCQLSENTLFQQFWNHSHQLDLFFVCRRVEQVTSQGLLLPAFLHDSVIPLSKRKTFQASKGAFYFRRC